MNVPKAGGRVVDGQVGGIHQLGRHYLKREGVKAAGSGIVHHWEDKSVTTVEPEDKLTPFFDRFKTSNLTKKKKSSSAASEQNGSGSSVCPSVTTERTGSPTQWAQLPPFSMFSFSSTSTIIIHTWGFGKTSRVDAEPKTATEEG